MRNEKANLKSKNLKRGGITKLLFTSTILFLLVFTSTMFIGCGTTKQIRDKDNSTVISLPPPPAAQLIYIEASGYKSIYYAGQEFSAKDTIITGTYDNGETADISHLAVYSGYSSVAGTYNITVNVQDQSEDIFTTFEVEVMDIVVDNIEANYTDAITIYPTTLLDSLKQYLIVTAHFNNGDTMNLTETEYALEGTLAVGISTITVKYAGKETTFTVNVTEVTLTLQSIEITVLPNKTSYYIGDSLDTTGMVVIGYYNNDTNAPITEYTLSGFDSSTAGTKTITVTVAGAAVEPKSFTVDVHVFALTVQIDSTWDNIFMLPIHDNTENDLYIDWGDGTAVQHYTGKPADGQGVSHTYAKAGTYTIKLNGHTYFAGPYSSTNGGAMGFGFGEIVGANGCGGYRDFSNRYKLIGIDGNIYALLGDYEPANNAYMFYGTFGGCDNLIGNIPKDLFRGIKGVYAEAMFSLTFYNAYRITGNIPEGLFGNLSSAPAQDMFYRTFYGCAELTGKIPDKLFGNISGAPAKKMFAGTFLGCSELEGRIPAGLFGYLSGDAAESMFESTLSYCYKLTGSIPAGLFGNLNGAAAKRMFAETFYGSYRLTGFEAGFTFGNFTGDAAPHMYYQTFRDCFGLTGNIPTGLFGNFTGNAAAAMFSCTFLNCSGLTGFEAGFAFGDFTGNAAQEMFNNTFSGCYGLTGNIPAGLFGNFTGNAVSMMFFRTFNDCSGLTGPSAILTNGQKLYEAFPDAGYYDVANCYQGAENLDDWEYIPALWGGGGQTPPPPSDAI